MALPEAEILEIGGGGIRAAAWDDIEHVRVTRAFLNDPASVLRHLRDEASTFSPSP
jgi:predicted ATPase